MPKLVEHEVRTFITNAICEKCEQGHMIRSVESCTVDVIMNPPTFKHVCNKCGNERWYENVYPSIGYKYIDTAPST